MHNEKVVAIVNADGNCRIPQRIQSSTQLYGRYLMKIKCHFIAIRYGPFKLTWVLYIAVGDGDFHQCSRWQLPPFYIDKPATLSQVSSRHEKKMQKSGCYCSNKLKLSPKSYIGSIRYSNMEIGYTRKPATLEVCKISFCDCQTL